MKENLIALGGNKAKEEKCKICNSIAKLKALINTCYALTPSDTG